MAPRRFSYSRRDWARLRPLSHSFKGAVRSAVDAWYSRKPAADPAEVAHVRQAIAGRTAGVIVAFNAPWAIELQARACRRHLPDMVYAVGDNSSNPDAAAEIRAVCTALDLPYVRLPPNPSRAPSRSHGFAVNWIYRNVIRPAAPRIVALLDHDLFPVQPIDLAAKVADQPVFGLVLPHRFGGRVMRSGHTPWYLWPGYLVMDFAQVAPAQPDFRQDWFSGMDTGGMMWRRLYWRLDRSRMRLLSQDEEIWHHVPVGEAADGTPLEIVFSEMDGWVHSINAGEHVPAPAQKRAFIIDYVSRRAGLEADG